MSSIGQGRSHGDGLLERQLVFIASQFPLDEPAKIAEHIQRFFRGREPSSTFAVIRRTARKLKARRMEDGRPLIGDHGYLEPHPKYARIVYDIVVDAGMGTTILTAFNDVVNRFLDQENAYHNTVIDPELRDDLPPGRERGLSKRRLELVGGSKPDEAAQAG